MWTGWGAPGGKAHLEKSASKIVCLESSGNNNSIIGEVEDKQIKEGFLGLVKKRWLVKSPKLVPGICDAGYLAREMQTTHKQQMNVQILRTLFL